MIVHCDDCDEPMCSCCEGESVGKGRYICDDCAEDREEAEAAGVSPNEEKKECGACGVITALFITKNEGIRCIPCAHTLEVSLLGMPHDAATCQICTPPVAA